MNFFIVCLLLFLFGNNPANSEEYIEVRRRTRTPMGTIVIATPNAQRRQGIGYSTTILHQTPGSTDQFAQSEIQVNLGNINTVYHEPTASQNYIGQYTNNYHKVYEPPKSQVYQVKPQHVQQPVTSAPVHGGFSIGPQQEQNTFNVGYSIGFGSSGTETKANYEAPHPQPQQSQRIQATLPRPTYNRAPDIVTGTPTTKVSKPKRMKLEKYRKDYAQQNYHHHHQQQPNSQHQHHHQRTNQQYATSHSQLAHNEKLNQNADHQNKLQYSALTNANVETYSYDSNANAQNKQNDNSYGWINLSPSVEMASSTNHPYKTARGASLHNIQHQNLHHNPTIVQQQHPQQQHPQPQNATPQQYSQPLSSPQPQFLQQQHPQQQFSQPHIQPQYSQQQVPQQQVLSTHTQSFDHDQALGNSQGFDHTNIINYEQSNSNERGGIDNNIAINDNYMQNSLTTSSRQFHPQQSEYDQENKDVLFKQYQPNTINWFNSQDAITQEIQQHSTIAPTSTSSNLMQKTVSNSYYFGNPAGQKSQAYTQVQYHNDPNEQQTQQIGNVISHQKHQNYYQPQPVQQSPTTKYRQQQKSNNSNNNNSERQHYQQQKHSGTIHSGAPSPTRVNQRFSNSVTSYSSVQPTGPSQQSQQLSDQSHPYSTYSKAPQEQIIKGKPKKPGVVRHPRLLAAEQLQQQQQQQLQAQSQSQSQNIPVTVVRNLSGSQSQINHAANINSALRPPAPNNNGNSYRIN